MIPSKPISGTMRAFQRLKLFFMFDFDAIRPYRDEEARPVLNRILADPEFLSALARFRFPYLPAAMLGFIKPLIRWQLRHETRTVCDVRSFQAVIEKYMTRIIQSTTTALTVSGVEKLNPKQAYLFISNHRDIAMDPALMNWVLFHSGMDTARIAIGDNLLTKPFASDLMRLNKSFLVSRGEMAPKKIYAALKNLSAYIYHSIAVDNALVWIAQREGRAKEGIDSTEEAIIKMFAMSKPKDMAFPDFIRSLHIVPVAISYEWDPCDIPKARELYYKKELGAYQKDVHEDVHSIAKGIAGQKGRVHVSFGDVLQANFNNAEAVKTEIDRQIFANYRLWPSNYLAANAQGKLPTDHETQAWAAESTLFKERLTACPVEYRPYFLAMYANPAYSALAQPTSAQQPVKSCDQLHL